MDYSLSIWSGGQRDRARGLPEEFLARLQLARQRKVDVEEFINRGRHLAQRTGTDGRPRDDPSHDTTVQQALSHLGLDPDDFPTPEDIVPSVLRLRRSYSTTAPNELRHRVDERLRQIRLLLPGEKRPERSRDLAEGAAWLTLLRGTVLADMSEFEAAQDSIEASRDIARSIGHDEIEAWTWETSAWMATTDGRHRDARDLADQGVRVAPVGNYGLVAVTLQRARIGAALHDETGVLADLAAGQRAMASAGDPEWPDDHYSIDSAKVAFFTSGAMAKLKRPAETIEFAREVVRRNEDPTTHNFWPMRVANARVEWATALADLGEDDGAEQMAMEALDPHWLRPDTERRMDVLLSRLRDHRVRRRLMEALLDAKAQAEFRRVEQQLLGST